VGLFIPNFHLHKFITCGTEYITTFLETLNNKFWIDVFKSYITLHSVIVDSIVAADSPLFYNPQIHIGGKPFFNKLMFDSNIRMIIMMSLSKMLILNIFVIHIQILKLIF
jgi:hypothetical protein